MGRGLYVRDLAGNLYLAMIKRLFKNDWFCALLFLFAYLCTNSYIFAWDDQHLEIPLLKHLIDPSLYKGDYYVEGLAGNFSSYLYPILACLIRTDQIQITYLILFLISRYFMFYWMYRLWQLISGERFAAAMAVLMCFLLGRTEEFLYRTFSHQEFSYIFMFGGFYYFYRERFCLAALLFGIGANFHAVYCIFPMLYMSVYILFFRQDRVSLILKTSAVFVICALPFLMWQVPHSLHREAAVPVPASEWLPLYLISCQQNFLFWTVPLAEALKNMKFMLTRLEPYLFLLGVYAFLIIAEPKLRKDAKTHVLVGVSYTLIVLSFIFSYLIPSRFMIDLNLLRNEQFVRYMLMGYTTVWACRVVQAGKLWQALIAAVVFIFIGFGDVSTLLPRLVQYKYVLVFIFVFFIALVILKTKNILTNSVLLFLRKFFIVVPLLAAFGSFSMYHYYYLQTKHHGMGMWQMYRNWRDMQEYVRLHTPKDAMVMTPYDTEYGGFRIFSERKVLVCYRDCGLIGFDYASAVEWDKRIKDIQGFVMYTKQAPSQAIINGILKYKVDYIVFMNYYQPVGDNPLLKKLYQNEVFALYEVTRQNN